MIMAECPVCHYDRSRKELVDEVFNIDGRYVLVTGAPAMVCARCGERSFSSESVEQTRRMIQGGAEPDGTVEMEVFNFASQTERGAVRGELAYASHGD